MKKSLLIFGFILSFGIVNIFSQDNRIDFLQGSWLGKIDLGISLRLVLKFDVGDEGIKALLDSPDQGLKIFPWEMYP